MNIRYPIYEGVYRILTLYIMDYKVMLTNKYLREINAKFYLCKKMNDGSDKSDIRKMAGGAEASPPFRQAGADGP